MRSRPKHIHQPATRQNPALALVDVRVIDHMIIAGHNVVSMAELGLL